jgi:hypothetical protein
LRDLPFSLTQLVFTMASSLLQLFQLTFLHQPSCSHHHRYLHLQLLHPDSSSSFFIAFFLSFSFAWQLVHLKVAIID